MSGTGSDSGWLEAAIAWEVCASLHRQYCKGKDALFTTRQSDFVKHAENARGRAHPAQEARLNPDMPVQELRLHMGELTTDEVLVARAAIRWANSQKEARVPLTSEQQRCIAEAHNVAACEEYFNARPQIDYIANRRIFEAGFSKGYGITAAQKETP